MSSKYQPNTLVTELAKHLLGDFSYVDNKGKAQQFAAQSATNDELADALANDPSVTPLVAFAGFLGGSIKRPGKKPWRVFYLDPKLVTWLIMNEDDIVAREQLVDPTAPFGQRDMIWLRSSASVTDGSGQPRTQDIEAEFLRGDFVGAGDFSASLTGGTFSRATGLLCEVQTPGCCGRRTQ
jgi:hypothetical protein